MNQNWNELWKDDDIKTDRFMPPKIFYKVLNMMDSYGKDKQFAKLFWEELEDAFNKTMGDNFIKMSRDDAGTFPRYAFTLDDDKVNFNFGSKRDVKIGEES